MTKQITLGLIGSLTLITGGGVLADTQINPYTDKGTYFEISKESVLPQSGTSAIQIMKAEPKIVLSKWNGTVNTGISYSGVTATGDRRLLSDVIEWKNTKQEVHAYPVVSGEGMEDGGIEIDLILNEKPSTNVFNFSIDGYENLDFSYQAPLNEEMASSTCTATDCGGNHRPENVVGSYAVYHKTAKDYKVGGTNYGTGKAYHIYRPKVFDAKNNETWASLGYKDGVLSVTVPQKFLDSATYPVRVDPTFGYTTAGGSSFTCFSGNIYVYLAALSEAGSVSSMSTYVDNGGATLFQTGIYDNASPSNLKGSSAAVSLPASPAWTDSTVSAELTAASYNLGWNCNTGNATGYYDWNAAASMRYVASAYGTWPATVATWSSYGTNRMSIYATYTVGGGTAAPAVRESVWDDL